MHKVEATFPNSEFNPFEPVRLRNGGEVGSLRIVLDGRMYCIRGKYKGGNEEHSWTIDGRRYSYSVGDEDEFDLVNYDPNAIPEPKTFWVNVYGSKYDHRIHDNEKDAIAGSKRIGTGEQSPDLFARVKVTVEEGEGL